MKRAALEDPGDRAQTRRKLGNVRIPLEQIGFHEENRGGLGIFLPHHAHEVCNGEPAPTTALQGDTISALVEPGGHHGAASTLPIDAPHRRYGDAPRGGDGPSGQFGFRAPRGGRRTSAA